MKILVVPGDGIGPEITRASLAALEALEKKYGLALDLSEAESGLASLSRYGVTVRDEDIERARRSDGVILGPMSVREYPPPEKGGINVPAAYRTRLGLYANVRPAYVRQGVPATVRQMDLVMVRENLEDFYVDRNMFAGCGEFMPTEKLCIAVGKISAEGSQKVARVAFDIARRRARKKVTIVHKAPVLKAYHGLFVEEAYRVARDYPDVAVEDLLVDAVAALLVRTPERFDVVLTTNMLGDILSDEAAELAGSLGLAASLNHGDESAVAQAGHGSAPDIAGQDIANPASLMLSVAMLLEHLGAKRADERYRSAGRALTEAIDSMLASPETRTRDLGGRLGTQAFGQAVAKRIAGG